MVLGDIIRPGTTRGLDFVIIDELSKKTGVIPSSVLKFALVEMVCSIEIKIDGGFYRLTLYMRELSQRVLHIIEPLQKELLQMLQQPQTYETSNYSYNQEGTKALFSTNCCPITQNSDTLANTHIAEEGNIK